MLCLQCILACGFYGFVYSMLWQTDCLGNGMCAILQRNPSLIVSALCRFALHFLSLSVFMSSLCLHRSLCLVSFLSAVKRNFIPKYFNSLFHGGVTEVAFMPGPVVHENLTHTGVVLECEQACMLAHHNQPFSAQARHREKLVVLAVVVVTLLIIFVKMLLLPDCTGRGLLLQ